jgi:hypothetical protein
MITPLMAIFIGIALGGVLLLTFATLSVIQRIGYPRPDPPRTNKQIIQEARTRWTRDWEEIERELNK